MEDKQRTAQQNKALHVGFKLIADALNDAGLDMRTVLKPGIEIPWDPRTMKEYIFRPVMKLKTGKDSTTELSKHMEIDEVWEILMRFLMQNHGVEYIPFPFDEDKVNMKMKGLEYIAEAHQDPDYPEMTDELKADKF